MALKCSPLLRRYREDSLSYCCIRSTCSLAKFIVAISSADFFPFSENKTALPVAGQRRDETIPRAPSRLEIAILAREEDLLWKFKLPNECMVAAVDPDKQ